MVDRWIKLGYDRVQWRVATLAVLKLPVTLPKSQFINATTENGFEYERGYGIF
jgi:hypothetical protein